MRHRAVTLGAALALALSGCASGFASSAGDFSAYRATRVAPTLEGRLAAAQRYLQDRPNGVFHTEVRAWFIRAEELFYASKKGSRTGLAAYLEALPKGPHGEEATRRATELDAISRNAQMDKLAAEVEARVAGPGAAARTRFRKELDAWLTRFLDPEVFAVPMSAAKADLVIPFSLSLPSPRCALLETAEESEPGHKRNPAPKLPATAERTAARRCAKLLELRYDIEGTAGPEPREAALEITVVEDVFGAPLEVTVGGPDLFLRLEETYRLRPAGAEDRAAAGARAAAFVRRAFAQSVSDAKACVHPVEPPAALRLGCEGVQVEVFPTAVPGEDNLIVIVPLRAPTEPSSGTGAGAP